MIIELNKQQTELVGGADFFYDVGKAMGAWLQNNFNGDVEWYAENAEAIRAADSSGML